MIGNIIKSKIFWVIVILIAGASSVYFFTKEKTKIEFVTIKREDIVQDVSATGNVMAAKDVDLSFETNGNLSSIKVSVGQKVQSGDVLMALNANELFAQQKEAESALTSAQAKLDQTLAGTRQEEIQVYESTYSNAKSTLLSNESLYLNASDIALSTSEDVITDNTLNIATLNSQTLNIEQQFLRQLANSSYLDAKSAIDKANSDSSEINILDAYSKLTKNLNDVQNVLSKISNILDNTPISVSLTQSYLDGLKDKINTQRSTISTDIVSLASAKAALDNAKNQLNLKKAGPTKENVDLAQSQVKEAEDHLSLVKEQIKKSYIVAPFEGVVGKIEPKIGEYITAGIPEISLVSVNNFQIEADITEIDIPKIKIGNPVNITFDAFGNNPVWQGAIIEIDSSPKTVEGVVYYKVTIDFNKDQKMQDIKSGMSANVDIITAESKDALVILQRLMYERDGKKFIKILRANQTIEEKEITTGLRGNGMIEILSGANEGDNVIIDSSF